MTRVAVVSQPGRGYCHDMLFARLVSLFCLCLVLTGCHPRPDPDPRVNQRAFRVQPSPAGAAPLVSFQGPDFSELAQQVAPTVVNIAVLKSAPTRSDFPFRLPGRSERLLPGQGSGVIIDPEGWILTNNHVVSEAKRVRVTTHDGREWDARVEGTDPSTDLALIQIESDEQLPAAPLGDSEQTRVGEWVMAIGNPFGLEETVTVGVISGKGRVIGAGPFDDFLQTDASINPGNSGGPLFNAHGQVIGINTAILAAGQGIGFAVPSSLAAEIAESLRREGHVVRGFIGVSVQPLTPRLRQALQLPPDLDGVVLAAVLPEGPAAAAGLQAGDVLTEAEGKAIETPRQLVDAATAAEVGSRFEVTRYRDGESKTVTLTVAERDAP
ncbi:MAG: S1C family serine protease [Vulcanimicrobiota bacterium]